jgi:hypothetical protein
MEGQSPIHNMYCQFHIDVVLVGLEESEGDDPTQLRIERICETCLW